MKELRRRFFYLHPFNPFWFYATYVAPLLLLSDEANLVRLIKQLRVQYSSPNAKFVTASLGQTKQGATDGGGLILDAMEAVDGTGKFGPVKYPEFKGNVAAVYSNPLMVTPSSSGGHYGHDARTYMNVGHAMGEAMVGLLKGDESI